MWYKRKFKNIKKLHLFGCEAYATIPKKHQKKFEAKATRCIMMGYNPHTSGYILYDPKENVLFTSRDVVFNEYKFPFTEMSKDDPLFEKGIIEDPSDVDYIPSDDDDQDPEDDIEPSEGEEPQPGRPKLRRSTRENRGVPAAPLHYPQYIDKIYLVNHIVDDYHKVYVPIPLRTIDQALNDPTYKQNWLDAITVELDSLDDHDTWELVPYPENLPNKQKPLRCRWVFDVKYRLDGSIERFKARLVARGDQQTPDQYEVTFAPVAKYTTFRILCAMAARDDLELDHLDIKTAYLNGLIDKHNLYMHQPPGCCKVKGKENYVCKLKKGLYGLKQSGKLFNTDLHNKLLALRFTQSYCDECLYFKTVNNQIRIYVLIYVDDLIICSKDKTIVQQFKDD